MENRKALLEVSHLAKRYKNAEPLTDVNCKVYEGEVISIIGPSGTGKSTLLRCINRLEIPDQGEIRFDGQRITDEAKQLRAVRRRIGMVFQSYNLFSNMTVLENVSVGPKELQGLNKEASEEKAKQMLKEVGLLDHTNDYPDTLSGGQKQRVAIARALCMDPKLLLMDEPTSALDPAMADEVQSVIRGLAQRGYTMLIVTHDMHFAETLSTRVFFMNNGIIREEGSPDQIFHHPQSEDAKIFINRLKILEKTFDATQIDYAEVVRELAEFGRKQYMSSRMIDSVIRIFEEAVLELILKKNSSCPAVMKVICSDGAESCEVLVTWRGEEGNPLAGEALPQRIINGMIRDITYESKDGANTLRFHL